MESDIDYWQKALNESDQTLTRLKAAIRYETAVNDMCREKLESAKEDAK